MHSRKSVSLSNESESIVYLVGAGPGRADLISVRGAELIKSADCIVCDKLVNPVLLRSARPDAEIVNVPKRIGDRSFTQDQINRLLVEKARVHQRTVRLKGGDPGIFGRCSEEAAALAEAGIRFEIVPGITAGIAAAEYSGIMLTDRQYSSQVVFVTGKEAEGKDQSNIDWRWLANFGGTIVFYMGVGSIGTIAGNLTANGMSGQTPAAVIADATFPTQRVVRARLSEIEERCRQQNIEAPAVIVVGAAAEGDERLNWFMSMPLFGKTIIVTRDVRGNAEFAGKVVARAGTPVEFATIEMRALTHRNEFVRTLAEFSRYEWVVFTSRNGVTVFFDAMRGLGKDARVFGHAGVAAIGEQTASELARCGIRADFTPTVFTGKELGRQLLALTDMRGKKVVLLRSEAASGDLPDLLRQGGAEVQDTAIYTTVAAGGDGTELSERIRGDGVDWVTFASPSAVRAFVERIPTETVNSSKAKVASIGPVTSQQLRALGVRVDLTAQRHTIDGLLDAIEEACR